MTIKIQPAQTITDGIVMSKEAFLEVSDDVPSRFTNDLYQYVATGRVKIMTASLEQENKGEHRFYAGDGKEILPRETVQRACDLIESYCGYTDGTAEKLRATLAQPGPEHSEHFGVVIGCARTYAYEYSQKDDRLINAAYKRLEFNLRAALAAAKGGV